MSESTAIGSILSRTAVQARSRAVLKTAFYRVVMIVVTITVAFVVTGEVTTAINIGLITNLVKTVTYYLYERLWAHVSWGVPS